MTVRIVTDSTCDLSPAVVKELGITVVPLHVYFGHEEFEDGVTISTDDFYDRLTAHGAHLPRTSAPSSGTFKTTYEALAAETDQIASIHVSAQLSATYNSALVAMESTTTPYRLEVIDSTNVSLGLGLLVVEAARMARNGAGLDDIRAMIQSEAPRTRLFGALGTLEYLHRGGRIGRTAAFLGSMLHVKPIICLKDGAAHPIERVRGRSRAIQRMCQLILDHAPISRLVVGHTTDEAGMESLAAFISERFPDLQIQRARCGPTLGTYFGPGAFGVALVRATD
ncbi:MAG: DegV family protein [Dehalococcoidia bacterium]|nr:DegV family protein [Dehalococcoidia bacterium]